MSETPAASALVGQWSVTVKAPTGAMASQLNIEERDGKLTGSQSGEGTTTPIDELRYDNGQLSWRSKVTKPMTLKLEFRASVVGNEMSGKVNTGLMGSFPFTGVKER
jgi:hypothetical protein